MLQKCLHDSQYAFWARQGVVNYLARHGDPVQDLFAAMYEEPVDPEGAMRLAVEHAPEHLPSQLQRGLQHQHGRRAAVAILALLDTDWSRRWLIESLEKNPDRGASFYPRLALQESRHPEAHRALNEWEAKHPGTDEVAPVDNNGGKVTNREHDFYELMSNLHDSVHAIRPQLVELKSAGKAS